jgi:hypothetical protein
MIKMKDIRSQSAYLDANEQVIVKQGGCYYKVLKVWPDTQMAPMGRALYIEIEEIPDHLNGFKREAVSEVSELQH